jgi:uncharacterized membrane protein YoaK (UPF0700 family)
VPGHESMARPPRACKTPRVVKARNSLLLLLSLAAGCVDAIAFINTGVFPANMTGNSVVLGSTLLQPSLAVTGLSALALLGFCLGAAVGVRLVHSREPGWSPRVNAALVIAGLLVLAVALAVLWTGEQFLFAVILVTAAAMGMQSAAVQQIGVAGVATVFVTGTLTTAISRLVGAATFDRGREIESRWLPGLTWFCYFTGAVIGGIHRLLGLDFLFALPGLLLLIAAGCAQFGSRQKSHSKAGA